MLSTDYPLLSISGYIDQSVESLSQLVMGSGSKSWVRVGFGYCFSGSGRVRVNTFGFLSGLGNFSRVRVGFLGFKIWNF